jgi:hypothetical protein
VRGQQRHQLVALTGLAPTPLSILLETGIGAHLWWATGTALTWTTVAEWRAAGTTGARTTIAKRRAWTTRTTGTAWPIAERRTLAAGPIAERWAWTGRPVAERWPTRTWDWRWQAALEGRPFAATVRATEPFAAGRWAATAPLTALATTATSAWAALAATATARPDRHVAATAVVVVHTAPVRALASATALTVAVWPHLDNHRRPIVDRWGRRGCDSKLLEVRKLLQQRFLKALSHPFSYRLLLCTSRARSWGALAMTLITGIVLVARSLAMRCLLSGPARDFGHWLGDRSNDHGGPSPVRRPI